MSDATMHVRPTWLREGLDGDFNDQDAQRRNETRHVWVRLASIQASVRITNVSENGVGLITRESLPKGQRIRLTPDGRNEADHPYDSATLRVVHCTPTINGFKVGCVFE
ncbi:MAG: PilZ domain-containing protein [Planctomycetota bacterium]